MSGLPFDIPKWLAQILKYGFIPMLEISTQSFLNKLRERAYAAIHGLTDDIGWFEWSAPNGIKFDNSSDFWLGVCQANPSLGYTVHPDNIRGRLVRPRRYCPHRSLMSMGRYNQPSH
jgi:hypothetical protein